MANTVIGLMENRREAEQVVLELVDGGFDRQDIGLMSNQGQFESDPGTHAGEAGSSQTGSAALKGAGAGAALGGLAGVLVGLGALAIPGIGPVIAAGPLAAGLAGAGIGAVAGGLVGALTNMGVPEEEARYYAEGVRRGGTLVTVNCPDGASTERAASIMRRHGAVDINERAEQWKQQGWSGYSDSQFADRETGEVQGVLPVVDEELQVGKREVSRGGVRVSTDVAETPVEETVRLREERARVERRPTNRPANEDDLQLQNQAFEVRESAEEPVVGKRAVVTEEVLIGKETEEHDETIRDSVRHTDVNVQHTDAQRSPTQRSTYRGPERRLSSNAVWTGVERRMSMGR
jgi:uncharacterized protein (TIGR02271 family)